MGTNVTGGANAPLTADAVQQGPSAASVLAGQHVGLDLGFQVNLNARNNQAAQLTNQGHILTAVGASMSSNHVEPKDSPVNNGMVEGILESDLGVIDGGVQKSAVDVATTTAVALTGLQTVDGVSLTANKRVLVKNGAAPSANYTQADAATTANIADLTNASVVIDGVTLIAGKRVLVQHQTLTKDNGLYVVGTVAVGIAPLTRATDMDATNEVILGKQVAVAAGGTANGGKTFVVSAVPAALGTNPVLFENAVTSTVPNSFNGLWSVETGAWTRTTDASEGSTGADIPNQVRQGMAVPVTGGTANGGKIFVQVKPNPITLGVSALKFIDQASILGAGIVDHPKDPGIHLDGSIYTKA